MNQFGLSDQNMKEITEVLERYPQVHKAVIYGSRATGTYRPGSDIDLTLFGDESLTRDVLLMIMSDIEDTWIPHFVDLSIFDHIQNEALKEKISRQGKVFYEKKKMDSAARADQSA
ncbi:MAG: nucleotidyltransferase domain-containing protein [Bacteroidetes bacterium]|nr:hypothetical protein [Saprospirales bacterium]RME01247.1 MAG: nucleotidyltransferase domain-containing protein [Bacteroidota bacterium]